MNSTVKRIVSDKGLGLILASDGDEYFFDSSAGFQTEFNDLREGQPVTFEGGQGTNGLRGKNVRIA